MIVVGHSSPGIDPLDARREVGERVCDAPSAARSLHQSWAEFCDRYRPGPYALRHCTTAATIARDAETLLDILNGAHYRLGNSIAYRSSVERMTAGSCYGSAA